jgi:hypothetical protein
LEEAAQPSIVDVIWEEYESLYLVFNAILLINIPFASPLAWFSFTLQGPDPCGKRTQVKSLSRLEGKLSAPSGLTSTSGFERMTSTRTVLLGAATISAAGLLGYALYFDHKRRNDVEFRKQLRKDL